MDTKQSVKQRRNKKVCGAIFSEVRVPKRMEARITLNTSPGLKDLRSIPKTSGVTPSRPVNEVLDDIRFVLSHDSLLEGEGIFMKAKRAPKKQRRPLRIKTDESPNRWAMTPEKIGPRVIPTA